MEQPNIRALFIIANAGFSDDVIEVARSTGVMGATILNARGESSRPEKFMGITVDTEKEMILCLVDEVVAKNTMATIKQKVGIETPAHCVCFTLPVKDVVGLTDAAGMPSS